METLFSILQIVVAVLLVVSIILQKSGSGLEGALGGGPSTALVKRTRRGFDKFIFESSIGLTILLIVLLLAPVIF